MQLKKVKRQRRAKKTRIKIQTLRMHRLTVHKTPRHIYAQIITPDGKSTCVAASTLDKEITVEGYTGNVAAAVVVGQLLAKRAKAAGVEKVAFDRSGFKYHGRVKALADAAREAGIEI